MKKKARGKVVILSILLIVVILAVVWQPIYKNVFLKAAYPVKYKSFVLKYSAQNKINPYLTLAVIKCESSFNPNAQSGVGALGLMQLTPPTFEWAMDKSREKAAYSDDDLYNPEVNIKYGTVVLSQLLREFGSENEALAAYHAGRTNVKNWLKKTSYSRDGKTLYHIPFADTRAYVKRVENTKQVYEELYK